MSTIRTRADLEEWAARAREAEAMYVIVRSDGREVARVQLPWSSPVEIADTLATEVRGIEGDAPLTVETISRRSSRYQLGGWWPLAREALR